MGTELAVLVMALVAFTSSLFGVGATRARQGYSPAVVRRPRPGTPRGTYGRTA